MLNLRAFQPQRKGDAAAVEALIAGRGINRKGQDFFGCRCGDFFDVHAAFGRADKRNAAGLAIDQQGQIQFAVNTGAIFDIDAVDLFACGAGLMGDQCAAQHFLGFLGSFGHRFGQANTARIACVCFFEFTFAAAAGVDLCLDHPQRAIKFTRGGFGIFCF